jgi:hypothetical protein
MATALHAALDLCRTIRQECSRVLANKTSFLINRQQCALLFNKLLETEKTLEAIQDKLPAGDTPSLSFPSYVGTAAQELFSVLKAANKTIIEDCLCNGRWMESAL